MVHILTHPDHTETGTAHSMPWKPFMEDTVFSSLQKKSDSTHRPGMWAACHTREKDYVYALETNQLLHLRRKVNKFSGQNKG